MIRPRQPKFKTILKVAISLAVVAFVVFIWANARPVPIQVRVTFTGFTNLNANTTANGTFPITLAFFCASNAGKCSVVDVGLYKYEIKTKPFDSLTSLSGGTFELKSCEFKTITMGTPDTTEPWRVSLSFSKADWREKLVRNPPSVLRKVLQFVPAKWLEPHPIEVHSDWINGPELLPVATNTTNTAPK
jgi:hypothetical protein